jgi:hypothetical protein
LIAHGDHAGMKHRPNPKARATIPEGVGPHVKLIFAEMRRLGWTYQALEDASGVRRVTFKAWRHKNRPSLENIEAVLSVLGWTLTPVPNETTLPPEVVSELRPIAERLGMTMPEATAALVRVITRIESRFSEVCSFPSAKAA